MIDEATQWRRFAAPLPPDDAARFMDCWQIGEQEAGLDQLVAGLLEHQAPISETVRAEISVASEVWGVRRALAPGLGQCVGHRQEDDGLRLIERDDAVQPSGAYLSIDEALAGPLVVPWIACIRCGQVLARVHDREPWGDVSFLPMHYMLFTPGRSTPTPLFAADSARDAWTELRTSCAQT
ncbi:hypothetical protein [Streptomyces sp. NPDC048419]|uniref:hypothetical protein n=1 Tax=Streptomyces sp. NPDC048419 TaxID=3365547 RepID=UPI003723A45B